APPRTRGASVPSWLLPLLGGAPLSSASHDRRARPVADNTARGRLIQGEIRGLYPCGCPPLWELGLDVAWRSLGFAVIGRRFAHCKRLHPLEPSPRLPPPHSPPPLSPSPQLLHPSSPRSRTFPPPHPPSTLPPWASAPYSSTAA